MKGITLTLAVATAVTLGTTLSAQTSANGDLTSNPVFEKNCAKCHGKTAEGRHFAGPSLKAEKVTGDSPDDLRTIIENGKGHMPKFGDKLSSDDISLLVEQIKALK